MYIFNCTNIIYLLNNNVKCLFLIVINTNSVLINHSVNLSRMYSKNRLAAGANVCDFFQAITDVAVFSGHSGRIQIMFLSIYGSEPSITIAYPMPCSTRIDAFVLMFIVATILTLSTLFPNQFSISFLMHWRLVTISGRFIKSSGVTHFFCARGESERITTNQRSRVLKRIKSYRSISTGSSNIPISLRPCYRAIPSCRHADDQLREYVP